MEIYVVGFYMKDDEVLLIEKQLPLWQKGKLNGLGGNVKKKETPLAAMTREFQEESGIYVEPNRWTCFCQLSRNEVEIWFFRTDMISTDKQPTSITNEHVLWKKRNNLNHVIPDLYWIIPMARIELYYVWPYIVNEQRIHQKIEKYCCDGEKIY